MQSRALKGLRVTYGIRQNDMAKLLGIAPKTMCFKENENPCRFTVPEIKKVCMALNMTVDDVNEIFFDGELPKGKKHGSEPSTGESI